MLLDGAGPYAAVRPDGRWELIWPWTGLRLTDPTPAASVEAAKLEAEAAVWARLAADFAAGP